MFQLRDYQERGVAGIRRAYASGRKSVCFVGPTGMGKGVVMAYIAHGATGKGNRMFVVVHRQELVRQTAKALATMGVPFGMMVSGESPQYGHAVQLCMIQSMDSRMDAYQPPNLIMIDEAHHSLSETYRQLIARYPGAKVLGLTATPQRLDGKGLGSVFEELVIGPTVAELIRQGFLCQPTYYAPPTELDMTGVRKTAGDFNRAETAERVDRPRITGSAVEHYRKICPGAPAVAFCATVKHAENVRDQFIAAGFPAASIDGKLTDAERIDRVARLTDGRIKVLTSVDVISEGFDLPSVSCAILLRPTESLSVFLQQVGRILRPAEGKRAFVLDHVGNCMRHGLAEEDRTWTLDGKTARKKSAAVVQTTLLTCRKCFAVHLPAPVCPTCGDVYPVKERAVHEVDGTLAQLTAAAVLAERERVKARQAVGMAKTRGDLEFIAKSRGYSPKWVAMMMSIRARKAYAAKVDKIATTEQQLFQ